MDTGTYIVSVAIGNKSAGKSVAREGDHQNPYHVSLPAAKALSAWVKTDANTAAGNLAAGHGLTTGVFDVYWDGGQRYAVTCTITGNAVALEGGAGTDFPATSDATVRISKQTLINTAIDGDAIKLGFIKLGYLDPAAVARGHLLFEESDGTDVADLDYDDGITANHTEVFDVVGGDVNPFAGDLIASCKASHSNTAEAADLLIVTLEDSTP